MAKYKKYHRNPGEEGLLIVNPGKKKGHKKYRRNPGFGFGKIKGMFAGMAGRSTPEKVVGLLGGMGLSRYATARILKDKDVGIQSLAVQAGIGFAGGMVIKKVAKREVLGEMFFLGSLVHAGWRYIVSTQLAPKRVPGFEAESLTLYVPAKKKTFAAPPASAPAAESAATEGLFNEAGNRLAGLFGLSGSPSYAAAY